MDVYMEVVIMIKRLQKVQEYLNNTGSDKFAKECYGKFLTGSITLIDGGATGTLFFRNGRVYDLKEGIPDPESGVDIGVTGSKEAWDFFPSVRRSLTVATSTHVHDPNNKLTQVGAPLRLRQNFNPLGELCRVYSCFREGDDPAVDYVRDPENEKLGFSSSVRGFYNMVNGIRIFCETNDGPADKATMICCHTAGRETRQYHDMMDIFADKYRMIAFDMPGHGKSWPLPGNKSVDNNADYGKWIWDVIQALGVGNPIVIGCSMGGNIVYHMAYNYPIRAFVSMQGSCYTPECFPGALHFLNHPYISVQHSHREFTECLIGTKTSKSRVDFIRWGVMSEIGTAKYNDLVLYFGFDMRDKIQDIDVPALIIQGMDDQGATNEMAEETVSKMTNCKKVKYVPIKGYGHFIIIEAPEKVCEIIDEFIQSL
jgi:pimeloyl-ACP methyl ester carboxylesterase